MLQLGREDLIQAYRRMCTIRAFEDRVHDEFSTGKIPGFVHLYAGEEASAVGVCMHLGDKDRIASTHRGHGHCIAKGCDVDAMMKEIYGRKDGLCGGKGGSMHIADLSKGMMGANGIVGGGPPLINSLVGITALSVSVPRPLKLPFQPRRWAPGVSLLPSSVTADPTRARPWNPLTLLRSGTCRSYL